jgi:hypothetical protein
MHTTKKSSDYHYDVKGKVRNLIGPYPLPSDNKQYLVFGFISPAKRRIYNCVFYIRLEDPDASEMVATVARALVTQKRILVSFNTDTPWDKDKDPSYVIAGARDGK